jgi:hypothetical protein
MLDPDPHSATLEFFPNAFVDLSIDPAFQFDMDPDPAFYFDAVPDPTYLFDADPASDFFMRIPILIKGCESATLAYRRPCLQGEPPRLHSKPPQFQG